MRARLWRMGCCIGLTIGCGGESARSPSSTTGGVASGDGGTTSMSQAGMSGGGVSSERPLQPPANIDLVGCAHTGSADVECGSCCRERGFPYVSSFDGACACGRAGENNGASVCASATEHVACSACCEEAGFMSAGGIPDSHCECLHHSNPTVCADVPRDPNPESRKACAVCCINAGYVMSAINVSGASALGYDGCVCMMG